MALYITTHKKLLLPKMTQALVEWVNRLSSKKEQVHFSTGHPAARFTLRLYRPKLDLSPYKFGLLIEIDGVPASVWMTDWPMAKKLREYLDGKKIDELPVDLRAELLEATLKPLLQSLVFHTNSQIRVLNFLNLKPTDANAFSLGFILRDNDNHQEAKMILLMHHKLFPVMQKLMAYWPDKTSDFWRRQDTGTCLELGMLNLAMRELKQLEPADILLMEQGGFNNLRLRVGNNHYFKASIKENNQLVIESGLQIMSNETNNEVLNSIDEVPVRITFDLGEIVMPFRDVQSLNKGYIIDLSKPVNNAVTIRSLNRVIGAGELVDIDGQIGVRITRLLDRKDAEKLNG